ncbi:hypothetical protein QCA50_004095 [Cerrena zonata]|uniref:Mitochondrial import inner membrane translocase subunit TIM16 n=1 Tax=Cerrena zonata TaxID=2478898 RepID=A0AAW0GTA1_9APHY
MSAPKIIVQIAIAGAQIFGKAFIAAGRQAIQNAKHRPEGGIGGADIAGIRNATSGSITDKLTLQHRMTLDEARLILNVKKEEPMEKILQHYEHLFKANSPPKPKQTESVKPRASARQSTPIHSHYLQSKVVRAKERLEAEMKALSETPEASQTTAPPPSSGSTTPPPSS